MNHNGQIDTLVEWVEVLVFVPLAAFLVVQAFLVARRMRRLSRGEKP